MKSELMNLDIQTRVTIKDLETKEVLVQKSNRIHPQNMSRIIARALANETNSIFYRMAFGNGGSYLDAAGNTVFNTPNDGSESGWESRLYNETYSEVIDEDSDLFKTDPGSADINTIRPGGSATPEDDPEGGGVVSIEVGKKSNVVITVVLNKNEPSGQLPSQDVGLTMSDDEAHFMFDEIGLYSPGKPAKSTPGYASVNVGDKISTDDCTLVADTTYNFALTVDGVIYTASIQTPSSGTGTAGQFTYGDLCEGINSGDWILSGDPINTKVYAYITDRSGGTYPTIASKQSYGHVVFESFTVGTGSNVMLECSPGDSLNLMNVLTNGVCANANYEQVVGVTAGVANNSITPENERERLLTHFIFSPILKSADRGLEIVYELTISVTPGVSSSYVQV